jgi:hypothetical protein
MMRVMGGAAVAGSCIGILTTEATNINSKEGVICAVLALVSAIQFIGPFNRLSPNRSN